MKATKALPLHWEATGGYYTYTPVVIIATDGKSEKCILSTTDIFDSILLRIRDKKAINKHNEMFGKAGKSYSEQVCQEFLDANYEIVERADGIFEVVYNEKHYPLNERIRISYQSTPQEEAAAKAGEEMAIENDEHYLACIAPLATLSHEEEKRLEAKAKAALEANRAYRKALSGLSSEGKEKLKAECEAAYEDYREYLEPLLEAESIETGEDIPAFLSKEERARLSVKAKATLKANRAYLKALSELSSEDKEKLKAEYKAAYDAYQEYLEPLREAEGIRETTGYYQTLSPEEKERLGAKAKATLEANRAYLKALSGLSSEGEERLKAEYKAAYKDYQEYLEPLREAEGIRETTNYGFPLATLSHEEEERLEAKAKAALEANRAYRKALFGLSSEGKEKLKAEYEAAYEDYREYRETLVAGDAYQEDLEPPIEPEEERLMAEEALIEAYSKVAK